MRHEFPVGGPVNVSARLRSSDMEIVVDDSAARVTVDVDAITGGENVVTATRVEMSGDILTIDVPKQSGALFRSIGRVAIRLAVPGGSSLKADSGSGDITVRGSLVRFDIKTGSSDVVLDRVSGSAGLTAASGDVTVRHAVSGQIQAKTSSGELTVGVPHGTAAYLDCSAVSGRVASDLDAGGEPDGDEKSVVLRLRSVSGDIRIRRA